MMKIGILVTTYNRPEYLRECLDSLRRADMPENAVILIQDDHSTDPKVSNLGFEFKHPQVYSSFWILNERLGIKGSLKEGCEYLIRDMDCDVIINLDGDALVRNDFVAELLKLHEQFPNNLLTGFECTNVKDDGSPRHAIESEGAGYKIRKTVGGINLLFTKKMYFDWILPALDPSPGNWDQRACLNAGNGVICASPSLIQHIGLESSMQHSGEGREMADISHTFRPLCIPDVTIIGVDSNFERLKAAYDESVRDIIFGYTALLCEPLRSKEEYSNYCIHELYKHVPTSHMLIIQHDGYVKNWRAWDPSWLQYDYIGAPWEWYTDGMQVGNGGFSFRSKRLMEILANDPLFHTNNHPEDHVICRVHRKYLETTYNIKFAPVEVARKFSIEGYRHWDTTYNGQFGFHSTRVKFPGDQRPGEGKTLYVQQYFGTGDVIFCVQLVRNLISQGYKAIWPVMPEMVEMLNRAYPDIQFIDVNLTLKAKMDNKRDYTEGATRYLPIRWTYELMNVGMDQCMTSKYDFVHMDWRTWRNAMFHREPARERALFKNLGLKDGESFTLVNRMWGTAPIRYATMPTVIPGTKIVEMEIIDGYGIFDWAKVIEEAREIYTVSTSIIYLMELLDIKCEPHIFIRKPLERDHLNYQHIMTRHKYHFEP